MSNKDEKFEYKTQLPTENSVIIGKLEGPCADIERPTRNGRHYTDKFWEKIFSDPIVDEAFSRGGIFGELGHPLDRDEVDMEKIAICMPEKPKANEDGMLIGHWDILNTPCGKIAKILCDYGYKIGISSRGTGDTYYNEKNEECVDEDTYMLNAFDLVLIPAVKDATLSLVTESVDMEKQKFNHSITEALKTANDKDRAIMSEALDALHVDYQKEADAVGIDAKTAKADAESAGTAEVELLQEALKVQQELQTTVQSLQEKLSVSYAKEKRLEEKLCKFKSSIKDLTEKLEKSSNEKSELESLKESLANTKDKLSESFSAVERFKKSKSDVYSALKKERAEHQEEIEKFSNEISLLQEKLDTITTDSKLKVSELNKKLIEKNKVCESYKKLAKTAIDKYIAFQADTIGVTATEIKNKLDEHYSFDDIDKVCESLRDSFINIQSLPIATMPIRESKVCIKEEKPKIFSKRELVEEDVDEQLLSLANSIINN